MRRYWVIAPVEARNPEFFDKVWQFDVANNLISIGFHEVGDISKMSQEDLSKAVASAFPDKPLATRTLIRNMLWQFYNEISPGDVIVARRGRKVLAAVGDVIQSAAYSPGKNPAIDHSNFLGVAWRDQPRDKEFSDLVFPMHTLTGISDVQFHNLVGGSAPPPGNREPDEAVDQYAFALERYLEEFIVSNFDGIFKRKLGIYDDPVLGGGQQFFTDIGFIDILAVEPDSDSFVVIELKKGRPSDQVVGQILRYMGWVKKNLCKVDQGVRGLVICHEPDPKLTNAIEMTKNIEIRYYAVSFMLSETP